MVRENSEVMKEKLTIEKLTREEVASPDVMADNIERLREIFPEVFADGVVDFFAGSGSTGDAIMQLNAEDAGDRRFGHAL